MSQETIDQILQKRRQLERPEPEAKQEDKFFSILVGDGSQETMLEIQSRDGLHTCFSFADVVWMTYSPDDGIMIEFGSYLVTIEGRGLYPKLFNGLKQKRVAWIKEADSELQDHSSNETFISQITILPPDDSATDAET